MKLNQPNPDPTSDLHPQNQVKNYLFQASPDLITLIRAVWGLQNAIILIGFPGHHLAGLPNPKTPLGNFRTSLHNPAELYVFHRHRNADLSG